MSATPHRCAIHPCREPCENGHTTCADPAHRDREPELLASYREHDERERARLELEAAQEQARREFVQDNPDVQRRTQEILAARRAQGGGTRP